MYDSQRYFCERNAGVKNNTKVVSLLLKSRQYNQRWPLLAVSRTYSILFNTVNAEAWGLYIATTSIPYCWGVWICLHILRLTCVCELIQDWDLVWGRRGYHKPPLTLPYCPRVWNAFSIILVLTCLFFISRKWTRPHFTARFQAIRK